MQTRTIANQMAEKLNAKLGYTAKVEEEEEVVETVTRYEEELEINDFPQTCRWRVTSRVCKVKNPKYLNLSLHISLYVFRSCPLSPESV